MGIDIISFTRQGYATGERIREVLSMRGEPVCLQIKSKYGAPDMQETNSLTEWTKEHWMKEEVLIFLGATGIAVRAIAPYVKEKRIDPAVLVIDEQGKYCIPLLSGHLGGANQWAALIAEAIGAEPIITTATDGRGVFAIDEYGKIQGLQLADSKLAKEITAALLDGRKIVTVGIGCKKGTDKERITAAVKQVLAECKIPLSAVRLLASIDLKREEPGILSCAEELGILFQTYSEQELAQVTGDFFASLFVKARTGVDNVCERSAIKASREGILIRKKTIIDHVTVAVAVDSIME